MADVLPVLDLRGLSTGDFAPALEEFFGTDAGLSASTVTRLIESWSDEYALPKAATSPSRTSSMCGPMECISGYVSRRTVRVVWSSSGSVPTGRKS